MKRWVPFVALLLIATPVAAQEVTLTIENTPDERSIQAGQSIDVGGDVTIGVSGVDCASEVPLPVNLTASASAPSGQQIDTEQGPVDFTLPAGAYHSEANGTQAGPYTSTSPGAASVSPASGVTEEYTADIELVAVFEGASSMECLPNEIPGTESDPVTVPLTVTPDQAPPTDGDTNDTGDDPLDGGPGGSNDTTAPPDGSEGEGDNGIPVPWQIAPLALALCAFALRRRR